MRGPQVLVLGDHTTERRRLCERAHISNPCAFEHTARALQGS
jgi:hypothetical protein